MIKKIFVKLLISCVLVIAMFNLLNIQSSYAFGGIFPEGKDFLEIGAKEQTINQEALKDTSDTIYNTLLAIGVIVAVIIAMVLGIQFIVASADERAKVKEAIMPFVIGCFVVFGAFTIWKLVVNIGNRAETSIEDGPMTKTLQEKQYILSATNEDILRMTESEVVELKFRIMDLKRQTIVEITDEETSKLEDKLNLIEDLLDNKSYWLNSKRWLKYKEKIGENDEGKALHALVTTDLNSYKTVKELNAFMEYVTDAKTYFKIPYLFDKAISKNVDYNTLEKLLSAVFDSASKRKKDIMLKEMSGQNPADSEIEDIKENEYYKKIFN